MNGFSNNQNNTLNNKINNVFNNNLESGPGNDLKIGVMGIGGGGKNIIDVLQGELKHVLKGEMKQGIEFWVCDTDAQCLEKSKCNKANKVLLAARKDKGMGAGADPKTGKEAAENTIEEIINKIKDLDMLILTCGTGGGTGSGATPPIARAARQNGILTIAVITKPFEYEGAHRKRTSDNAIQEIQAEVDTVVVISNQNLIGISGPNTPFLESLSMADRFVAKAIDSIYRIVVEVGLINADFADFCAIAKDRKNRAMMGNGYAEGENAGARAMEEAMSSFLLDMSPGYGWENVDSVIICIRGPNNLTMQDIEAASETMRSAISPDANMIIGTSIVEGMAKKDENGNEIRPVEVFVFGTEGKKQSNRTEQEKPEKHRQPVWTDYKKTTEFHGNPHSLHEKPSSYAPPKKGFFSRIFGSDDPEIKEVPYFIPNEED